MGFSNHCCVVIFFKSVSEFLGGAFCLLKIFLKSCIINQMKFVNALFAQVVHQ